MSKIPVVDPFGVAGDPKMPFLVKAIDPSEAQRMFELHIPQHIPQLAGSRFRICAIRVVRYKQKRRCLIEYDLQIARNGARDSMPPEQITLMGKSRAKGTDITTYHVLTSLWNAGFGAESQDGISVPEPMGFIPDYHMLLQRKVPGDPATWLLAGAGGIELMEKIALAIHKLHCAHIPARRSHTVDDELRILHERLQDVAAVRPEWSERLERILESCDRLGASIPYPDICGIHRDFYPDQVIVDGGRLYLVDFDMYCEGDPALDIGNFLGHVKELGIRTLGDPDAFAEQEKALKERFVALAGEKTRKAVKVYTVLTLVRHIYLSTRFPDRQRFTETILELCERCLGLYRAPKVK